MSEKPKIPERLNSIPNKTSEKTPLTPEQQKLLDSFLHEKQATLATTNRKLHPETTKKTDYYELAAFFGSQENAKSAEENTINVSGDFITQDGVLKNISGKITINTILKTPGEPKIMTLQVPKNIIEGRGVAKDTPHDIRWDEKKKSYVYSSGPAEGLRPFIKDGMILKSKTTPTVPQNNNEVATKTESPVNVDAQISQVEALNDSEKQFCKALFAVMSGSEGATIQSEMIDAFWKQTLAQINKLSSSIMGYQNITDSNFITAMESTLRTILADKGVPEKIKIALENKVRTSKDFSSIKIDAIIHEKSSERFLTPEKLTLAEQKNKSFFESKPDIKKFVWEFLPKSLGYTGEMSYKQLSLLIAQLQTKHGVTPVDGFVTDIHKQTGQIVIQECSQAKIATTWKSGKIGDNNYLPPGIKFIAPLSNAEKEALATTLPEGKNLDDGIHDLSYQCASFLTYMNGGISGNAWTMPDFIISEGGHEIANTLRDCDWSKLPAKPSTEQIQAQIRTEVKAHPIDIKQIQVGDVVTMMHPKSKFQERAFAEGLEKTTRIVSTHVGQVTELNGELFVTHNIHGVIFTEPLSHIIAGKGLEGDLATGVFRLNKGSDWSSQFAREKDRLTRKAQKNLNATIAMIP